MVQGRRRFGTIASYLVGLVALQLILVLGLVAYAATQDFRKSRVDAINSMTTTAKAASHFLAEDMQSNRDGVTGSKDLFNTIPMPQLCASQQQSESSALDDRWTVTAAHFVKSDGSAACAYKAGQPNVASEQWFKDALASSDLVETPPVVDKITKKLSLIFAMGIPKQHLVIAISADLSTTGKALEAQFGSADHPVEFVVASKDRKIEIASTDGDVGRSLVGTGFSRSLHTSKNTLKDQAGKDRFWSEASVRDFGWRVYAGVRTSDAYAAARQNLKERAALGILFLALVVLAAAMIQRRIARPVQALRTATRRLTKGDFETFVDPTGPVELAELAEGFNVMVGVRADAETKLRKAFASEQHASQELRDVDQMRNAFLMAISHELRTPLTSVVGFATILQADRATMSEDSIGRCIDAVASQSKRLEKLLLDLLDIDRMGRGVLEPRRKDTDVGSLVCEVVERADKYGRIKMDVKSATRANVDPALVERILENLVTNAVKHTPDDSEIWVRAQRTNGHLELAVDDAGGGVPDALKLAVFEPFNQGDQVEHVSGTGVGLALVKQFAKLQGGDAWVEDREGGGASFRVVLPAANDEAQSVS